MRKRRQWLFQVSQFFTSLSPHLYGSQTSSFTIITLRRYYSFNSPIDYFFSTFVLTSLLLTFLSFVASVMLLVSLSLTCIPPYSTTCLPTFPSFVACPCLSIPYSSWHNSPYSFRFLSIWPFSVFLHFFLSQRFKDSNSTAAAAAFWDLVHWNRLNRLRFQFSNSLATTTTTAKDDIVPNSTEDTLTSAQWAALSFGQLLYLHLICKNWGSMSN